jgi:hypothetical protein
MNRFIKTLSVFLLVATFSIVSAQEKEADSAKKGAAKAGAVMDDKKAGGGKPVVEAKKAPEKLSSHETGGPGDKGYAKQKERVESKGNFFQRLFGGSKKKEKKENDSNN